MTVGTKSEIIERVWEKLHSTFIDCPACESMLDDPQYTCEVCWCEGGAGTIPLNCVINQFDAYED